MIPMTPDQSLRFSSVWHLLDVKLSTYKETSAQSEAKTRQNQGALRPYSENLNNSGGTELSGVLNY